MTSAHPVARLRRTVRRLSLVTGLTLAIARLCSWTATILLTLWSYSLWGSEYTPMAGFLTPALGLYGLSLGLRLVITAGLRMLRRHARVERRRRDLRRSRLSGVVPKL